MPDLVFQLSDPTAADPSVAGGKGATLARLRSLGFPVPDGRIVATEAYRRLVESPEIEPLIADLADAAEGETDEREALAATLREAVRSLSLPPPVTDALAALPPGQYAVRSSATNEDLPQASFAGQYDTYLGVEGTDALADAVLRCFASTFTDRAVAYRARNGVSTASTRMAVVVQRMVEPDASGIAFTADPISGDRTVSVVEAGPGRGDAQVSGTATADTVRFDADAGETLSYAVGDGRSERVLTDGDVRALVAIADRIAAALGRPQDVEWAIRDGEIHVLQSRPITALFPVPEPRPTDDRTHVYYSFGHRQGMPEAMPPLALDVWRRLTDRAGESFGLRERFTAAAGGRLYLDLTPFLRSPRLRERLLENFAAVDEPAGDALRTLLAERPDEFPASAPSIGGYWRAARSATRVAPFLARALRGMPRALCCSDPAATPERVKETYDARVERAARTVRGAETPAARVEAAHRAIRDAFDWLLDPFYGPFLAAMLSGFLLRRLRPGHREHVDALALGIEADAVYRMTMSIGDLADVARETPAVAAAIRDGATREELADRGDAAAFLDALDEFLDEYGFRAVGEIDPSRPRYREDPTPVVNAVAGRLETAGGEHRERTAALGSRARRARRALTRGSPAFIRPIVGRLASVYRGNLGIREHPKFALSQLLDLFRDAVLDAGSELESAGALSDRDDVWLLSYDELLAGLDDPRTLAGIGLAERRREFERFRGLSAPRIVTSDGTVPRARPERESGTALTGTGAAPGVAEGIARVVTDPGRERLGRGEVLVAPYTDPGWTPLFLNAAAVVTEVGGRLTHGSLVAREYGIPAVVAVADATDRIETGDRIRVDGTRGVVERLD